MKKLIGVILVTLSSTAFAQFPTNGLISKWNFTGGTATDSWGSNNGVITGATPITDRCGNPNSALRFNGITDQIMMPNPGPTGNASRSVSFWARTTNITGPQAIFTYGALTNGGAFQIFFNYNTCQGVGIDVYNEALVSSNSCVLDSGWHHIVAVFDNSGTQQMNTVNFYIDAVLQPAATCAIAGSTQVINTGTVYPIAISPPGGGRSFKGDLDDFFLYNRPLTVPEIVQLFNQCSPLISGGPTVCSGTNSFMATPVVGATSYTWTLPTGWTGNTSGNSITNISGSSSGTISVKAINGCGVLITQTLAITVSNCTGITSLGNVPELKIDLFPNPNSGNLMIDGLQNLQNAVIIIRDVAGKSLYSQVIQNNNENHLDVSFLSNGIYFVEVQRGIYGSTKKLVLAK